MKIFFLDDSVECKNIAEWLSVNHDVKYVKTIEETFTYIQFENGLNITDKFIIDASLDAGALYYYDNGEFIQKEYNGVLNGLDMIIDNFHRWGLNESKNKVAVLTAFDGAVKNYNIPGEIRKNITILSKNSDDIVREIQHFLNM